MADYVHEDNTGHGASVEFQRQRQRAAAMMGSWQEGAGIAEAVMSPGRQQRSSEIHNLRSLIED